MAGEMPPMLNLLASECAATYDHHGLAYMRFVIRESSESEQEALYKCLTGMKYATFLKTAYWQIIRVYVLALSPKCHRCRLRDSSHVHHRNYRIHGVEHDNTDSLVALCGNCHEREHELLPELAQQAREVQAGMISRGSNQGSLAHISDYILDVHKFLKGDPT